LTQPIAQARKGPQVAAFFDFDGTLLAGFSVFFFLYRRYLAGGISVDEALSQAQALFNYGSRKADFNQLLKDFTAGMAGVPEQDMRALAAEVFRKDLAGRLYPEARALVRAHQQQGHTVVMVSSATPYQLELAADELEIDHLVCTRLKLEAGYLTGEILGKPCYGVEKLHAAQLFAEQHQADLNESYFYSDGAEDIPLLEEVAHPRVLNPDKALSAYAEEAGWPVERFSSRGIPGLADITRTGLVYGSFLPSFLLGAPAWLLNRSRRDVINFGLSAWAEFGSAVAGLNLRVEGEQHLWEKRPAIFIFNHQSAVDVLVIARLMRRDFTGLAKAEMKKNPLLGPALSFAEAVFIDRERKGDPAKAMRPAVERLEQGLSIVVAPEGQRSLGYRPGPFRKGAFHLAMQAGVPIVPIVIANASDALPKSALCIRPATIDVTVLPPISTRNWKAATLDQHVRACREKFLTALGQSAEDAGG